MTEEEKKAIESLEKLVKLRKDKTNTIKHDTCICSTKELDIVLNLIQRKDRQIDLMLGHIDPYRLPIEEKTT